MQQLFHEKWTNFLKLYGEYLPATYSDKLHTAKFPEIFAAFYTYVKPLATPIKARDAEFLFQLMDAANLEFDVKKVYHEGLDDTQRDKLWRYAAWFCQWFDEYNAV